MMIQFLKKKGYTLGFFAAILIGLCTLPSCFNDVVNLPLQTNVAKTVVYGIVLTEDKKPMVGVQIENNGVQVAITDRFGAFSIDDIVVSDGRCILIARTAGYYTSVRAFTPTGSQSSVILTMAAKGTPIKLDASAFTIGNTSITDTKGLEVSFPANGFAKGGTLLTSGKVDVYVQYLSPTDDNFGDLMPGGDFTGMATDSSIQSLLSYGAVNVELEQNGQHVQIAPGKTAKLRFPAHGKTDATVPLWHFDETRARWIEDGNATLVGDYYEGQVSHFSPVNLDVPRPPTPYNITGIIIDCDNLPVSFLKIRFGQQTTFTGPDGSFIFSEIFNRNGIISYAVDNRWIPFDTLTSININDGILDISQKMLCNSNTRSSIRGNIRPCSSGNYKGFVQILDKDGRFIDARVPDAAGNFAFNQTLGKETQLVTYRLDGSTFMQPVIFPAIRRAILELGPIEVCTSNAPSAPGLYFTLIEAQKPPRAISFSYDEITMDSHVGSVSTGTHIFLYVTSKKSFNLSLQARKTGTFTLKGGVGLQMYVPNGKDIPDGYNAVGEELSFTILEYDSVGGRIKGTFSGRVRQTQDSTGRLQISKTINVALGRFNLIRTTDR